MKEQGVEPEAQGNIEGASHGPQVSARGARGEVAGMPVAHIYFLGACLLVGVVVSVLLVLLITSRWGDRGVPPSREVAQGADEAGCAVDGDCAGGQVCRGGACVAGAEGASATEAVAPERVERRSEGGEAAGRVTAADSAGDAGSGASSGRSGVVPESGSGGEVNTVSVPAGSYKRGSRTGDGDEMPVRTVFVSAFAIDRTEVTVSAYRRCVEAGRCTPPNTTGQFCGGEFRSANNWIVGGRGDHPINCVNWQQANDYCAWKGMRLPTEAEWEMAARGTDGRKYPWGNDTPTCGRAVIREEGRGCGTNATMSVGSKPAGASPFGALDMAGNVFEWVQDKYNKNFYARGPTENPKGPPGGRKRVLRGGSWFNPAGTQRSSDRSFNPAGKAFVYVGFRCAASSAPSE